MAACRAPSSLVLQQAVAAAPRHPLGDGADNSQPSERVMQLWKSAQAVCFDIDCAPRRLAGDAGGSCVGPSERACEELSRAVERALSALPSIPPAGTLTVNDALDLLAEFMGVGEKVAAITNSVRASVGRVGRFSQLSWLVQTLSERPLRPPDRSPPALSFLSLPQTQTHAGHGRQHEPRGGAGAAAVRDQLHSRRHPGLPGGAPAREPPRAGRPRAGGAAAAARRGRLPHQVGLLLPLHSRATARGSLPRPRTCCLSSSSAD